MIVDSTRRGKRFPDSMSKTIPIWTCVLNRAISQFRTDSNIHENDAALPQEDCNGCGEVARDWDCSLHLPLWVPQTEKASIEEHLEEWTEQLKASGADIASLAVTLKKPLRPLWISQKTVIWLNEVPHHDSWDFTPVILVSASSSSNGVSHHNRTTSEFSWNYIPGAGDDEESWSRGLTPPLFWNHVYDLINSGPEICNQKVADIVEKSRVRRAYRGENAPQIRVKSLSRQEPSLASDVSNIEIEANANESSEDFEVSWLGSTNLAIGASQFVKDVADVDCILNCDSESISVSLPSADTYLHLPMVVTVSFAKFNLSQGKRLLVCCSNGEDISVCVCLAILMSLFDEKGTFDGGDSFDTTHVTKWDLRRWLVFVCKFATNARPSRGNLRQVFNFLIGGKCILQPQEDDGSDE
ncbi:hypothetical protein RYX36_033349 [Vicia faba]